MTELNPFQQAVQDKIAKQGSPFEDAARKAAESEPSYRYSVLPLSEDTQGKVHFDPSSGVLGALKRAFTLPGEVAAGKVDPTSDEGLKRTLEMAGAVTPVNPAIRAGERAIPGALQALRPGRTETPTAEALKTAGAAGFEKARGLNVDYSSSHVGDLANSIRSELEGNGVIAELAPKSFKIIEKLTGGPPGSVAPYTGLYAARRALGNAAKDFANPTEQLAAKHAIDRLDSFLERPPAEAVVAGPAAEAGKLTTEARGNYAAAKRSEKLTQLEDTAELQSAAANSGKNLDNTIRRKAAAIVTDPKKRAGYSPSELKLIEDVARGNFTRNKIRDVGNLLGGGGGLGSMLTGAAGAMAGGAAGGGPGAALGSMIGPTVGATARGVANKLTQRALERADEAVRQRSPLFEQMQAATPQEAVSPFGRALGLRAVGLSAAPAIPPPTFADMIGPPNASTKRKKRR
jgi:hypothetical protein